MTHTITETSHCSITLTDDGDYILLARLRDGKQRKGIRLAKKTIASLIPLFISLAGQPGRPTGQHTQPDCPAPAPLSWNTIYALNHILDCLDDVHDEFQETDKKKRDLDYADGRTTEARDDLEALRRELVDALTAQTIKAA